MRKKQGSETTVWTERKRENDRQEETENENDIRKIGSLKQTWERKGKLIFLLFV